MKELSLNILDIAENSVKAEAKNIFITVTETDETLTLTVSDDGCGMDEEFLSNVTDPFCTTRTTRKVGLGIPLLKLSAEQTGGSVSIESRHISSCPERHGTDITAVYYKNHIDMTPLGDITATVVTLIQCNPDIDFIFVHSMPGKTVSLDTRQLREILCGVPLNNADVISWIKDNLVEQYGDQ